VSSEDTGSLQGCAEVVAEFVICECSSLKTTSDQVITGFGLRGEIIERGSEATTDTVSNYGISDLATDRVRYCHWRIILRLRHE